MLQTVLSFLLLGLSEDFLVWNFDSLSITYPTLLVAIAAVLVARLAVVYLLLPISDRLPFAKAVDSHSKKVMFWGGLRGVCAGCTDALNSPTPSPKSL